MSGSVSIDMNNSKETIFKGNLKSKEFKQLAKALWEEKNPKVEYKVTVTTRIAYDGNVKEE
jgi:hypothetical protein